MMRALMRRSADATQRCSGAAGLLRGWLPGTAAGPPGCFEAVCRELRRRGRGPPGGYSGCCDIAVGPLVWYPGVAAREQYQVCGGDDAGEIDEQLEG